MQMPSASTKSLYVVFCVVFAHKVHNRVLSVLGDNRFGGSLGRLLRSFARLINRCLSWSAAGCQKQHHAGEKQNP